MHIDQTEKKWVWITILMTAVMVGVLTAYAVGSNIHPPSGFEPIDSTRLHIEGEFVEDNLGVKSNSDGSVTLTMVAARYGFYPSTVEVPVDTPVKIRIASADVLHGVHVPFTNYTTMVVPGYVAEVNTTFQKTGDFSLLCNEYCGLGHDHMWSRLKVVPKSGS
jgi:cytochrome c oxidase subunit 2